MDCKILIGTWRKRDIWQETEYNLEDFPDRSKTSLQLLQKKLDPQRILIIALYTVADITNQRPGLQQDYQSDVQNKAKEKIAKFSKDNRINVSADKDILIATGKSSFPGLIFLKAGCRTIIYYLIFYLRCDIILNVMVELKDKICPGQNEAANYLFQNCIIEIHLDLTHGINFMPVLTYRALKEIVSLLEIFIDIRLYNLEPYLKDKPLQIHKLEESLHPTPLFSHDYIKDNLIRLLKLDKTESAPHQSLKQQIRELCRALQTDDLNLFFSSLLHGRLLALISYLPEQTIIRKSINNAIRFFYKNFEQHRNNSTLNLEKALYLSCTKVPYFSSFAIQSEYVHTNTGQVLAYDLTCQKED